MKRFSIIAGCALTLSACATITTGTEQAVYIDTPEMEGAECKLTDSKAATWDLRESPGSVNVTKGNGPMKVACKKSGYKPTNLMVEEEVAGATFGNVILGGGIGVIVDAASGAAQRYPEKVVVWMEPVSFESTAAREEWMKKKDEFIAAQKKAEEEKKKMHESNTSSAKH